MAIQKLPLREFSGGLATVGEKKDIANSARSVKNLNIFEDPSYLTLAEKATKISGTAITSLPHWMEDGSPHDTNRYVYDASGVVYEVDSADAVTELFTASSSAGNGMKVFDNYLYYAGNRFLGRYGPLDGTPTNHDTYFTQTAWSLDQSAGGLGAADYVPPVAIDEGATHRQTWTPVYDPLRAIVINVDDAGTGDWTLTVHDSDNNVIGTSTKANADVAVGNETFGFGPDPRMIIGNEYHFHVTSTVADGGIDTETATDLEGAYTRTYFEALITSDWHPMVVVEDTLIIGNERYLATWNQSEYHPNRVAIEPGFQIRSIARFEEFIVAAAYKGSSVSDAEAARLYFWDAVIASTVVSYNFYKDITIGVPNAITNSAGRLVGIYGNQGALYKDHDPFKKVTGGIPTLARGKKVEVYPGAISEYDGKTVFGIAGSTDDAAGLEQGIYQHGKHQELLSEALNFPYTVSTDTTQGTTLQIGMVKSFGTDLYWGWRDGATYGVDKVALGDDANASGSFETLIFDGGDPDKQFLPINVVITFEALTAGQSITPKYKLDRAAAFTTGTAASTVGDTRIEAPIYTRCNEIEFGFDIASTSNTYPKITGVILEYDDLAKEGQE